MDKETLNFFISVSLITFFENYLIFAFVMRDKAIKLFDMKNISILYCLSIISQTIIEDEKMSEIYLNRFLWVVLICSVIYLFYGEYFIKFRDVLIRCFYGLILMILIETIMFAPLIIFFELQEIVYGSIINTVVFSLPSRAVEILIINMLINRRKENVKEVD